MSFSLLADTHIPTGYEPNRLAEERKFDGTEGRSLFSDRPNVTSAYGTAESNATSPPESDSDDEQIRTMLAAPLCLQERVFISLSREGEHGETRRTVFTQEKVESRIIFR